VAGITCPTNNLEYSFILLNLATLWGFLASLHARPCSSAAGFVYRLRQTFRGNNVPPAPARIQNTWQTLFSYAPAMWADSPASQFTQRRRRKPDFLKLLPEIGSLRTNSVLHPVSPHRIFPGRDALATRLKNNRAPAVSQKLPRQDKP